METSPAPDRQNPASFWVNPWSYPLLAVFVLAALLGARLLFDSDLGFHLRAGQWIVENRAFPQTDSFTYTVNHREYLDIHWLYQVTVYSLYRLGGYVTLSLFNLALIVALFFLAWRRLKFTHAPAWLAVLLLALLLFTTENRFRSRPEIWSWVFMSLTLWVLELRALRKRDLLVLLPAIHLLWANAEGLFPISWALMGIYWFSDFLHNRRSDNRLLGFSLASVAACLLNPYFLKGFVFPFTLLAKLGTSNIFKRSIDEFQPTWTYFPFPTHVLTVLLYEIFFILLFVLLLATLKKRKIHELLLVAVFFVLSLVALRNISLFMIACLPVAASCWRDLKWDRLISFQRTFLSRPLAAWVFTLLLLGLAMRVLTGAYYIKDRRPEHFGLGLDEQSQPVAACRFLSQNALDGKILNLMNLGGWLDWQGPPGRTFIDGRLEVMGPEFFGEYMDSFAPGKFKPMVEKFRPDMILMRTLAPVHWLMAMNDMPDWRLVYLDGTAALYLRKGFGDAVPSLDAGRLLVESGISAGLAAQAPALIRASAPSAWDNFLAGFVRSTPYPHGLYNLGFFFAAGTGRPQMGEPFFLEALRRTGGRYREFYRFLAEIYRTAGHRDEAAVCMEQLRGNRP